MNPLELISDKLIQHNDFILLGHEEPDGDCIGSLFSLKWALDKMGKNSLVLLDSPPEERFGFLAIAGEDYRLFEQFKPDLADEAEVVYIALDAGDLDRLGPGKNLVSDRFLINIDHHPGNPGYGNLNYINPEMAAVGEILYYLFLEMGLLLDQKIGSGLALAIISDTGGFRYQNTRAITYRIMAELSEIGVDIYHLNQRIYGNYSFQSLKLKGLVLANLELSLEQKTAWIIVNKAMLEETGTAPEDVTGLVSYARDIRGVEVGVIFVEIAPQEIKVGLRSKQYCPVNQIAAFFGGGGHARAAGCKIKKDLEQTVELVLSKVKDYV